MQSAAAATPTPTALASWSLNSTARLDE